MLTTNNFVMDKMVVAQFDEQEPPRCPNCRSFLIGKRDENLRLTKDDECLKCGQLVRYKKIILRRSPNSRSISSKGLRIIQSLN